MLILACATDLRARKTHYILSYEQVQLRRNPTSGHVVVLDHSFHVDTSKQESLEYRPEAIILHLQSNAGASESGYLRMSPIANAFVLNRRPWTVAEEDQRRYI